MPTWSHALMATALEAAAAECNYVSGWTAGGPPTEATSRGAVTWGAFNPDTDAVDASNQPVLTVAGACQIDLVMLFHDSTGTASLQATYTVDPPIVFTGDGTLTLTVIELYLE